MVTIHTASVRLSAESPSPFPNGFLSSVSASAELSHALPCTRRREQLSPRLTSLTSNPQLLHSLHGPRHVIDHNTSEKGLNQTVSQTFSTRFPTCEMGGIIGARLSEARGGLRIQGETRDWCCHLPHVPLISLPLSSTASTRHINMGHSKHSQGPPPLTVNLYRGLLFVSFTRDKLQ